MPTPARHTFWISLLLAGWAVFGLGDHGVWWGEEAIVLVRIQQWSYGDPLALVNAPLFTLVSALTTTVASPWLSFETASRLASALFVLGSLFFTARAARALFGPGFGVAAALSLLGAAGLLLRAHACAPELAALFAYTLLLYGIGIARQAPRRATLALTAALLAVILARNLYDGLAAILILLAPLAHRDWRTATYRKVVLQSVSSALAGLALWFVLLQRGGAWAGWYSQALTLPPADRVLSGKVLLWFAWPLWPLATWALWENRRRLQRLDALYPLVAATLLTLIMGVWPSLTRDGAWLPVLAPLALLAAFGLESLRRGAAQAFYWFGVLCFFFFAALFWFYFAGLEWNFHAGTTERLLRLAPNYHQGTVNRFEIGLAGLATALWLLAIPLFTRAKARPVLVWATGMMLVWVLAIGLFRPWIDARFGYRPVWHDLAAALPAGQCVRVPSDPIIAAVSRLYLPGRTGNACHYQLIIGTPGSTFAPEKATLVWLGARAGQRDKVYRLYHVTP